MYCAWATAVTHIQETCMRNLHRIEHCCIRWKFLVPENFKHSRPTCGGFVSVCQTAVSRMLSINTEHWIWCVIKICLSGTPSLTGTATIAVKITDANDNAPVTKYLPNYPPIVPAQTTQGDVVFRFSAESPDMSQNPVFTYTYICNTAHCNDFSLRMSGCYFFGD